MDLLLGFAGRDVSRNPCLLLDGLPGSWTASAGLSGLRVTCDRQALASLENPGVLVKAGGITGHHQGKIAVDQIIEGEVDSPMMPDELFPEMGGQVSFQKRLQGFLCPWDLKEIDVVLQSFGADEFFPDSVEFSPRVGLVLYEIEERVPVGQSSD